MIFVNRINGLFISFILGGAIGSTLALLYATKSGKHLRNDISRKTNQFIDEGEKKTHDLWNEAKEKAESTLVNANDFLNTNVEKIVNKTENVREALKSGFNAYNDKKKS